MILKNGDCIKEMQKLIDDGVQVDSVVTDPPYELGFMGRSWDSTGIAFQKETWELAYKLLKPGGHLLAFSASRNYHRMAVAIEDVGFEIRDQMMWLYGSGFPKSMNVGKAFDKKLGNERAKTGVMKTHSNKGMQDSEERTAIGAGSFGQVVSEEVTIGNSEWEGWGTALKPAHEPIVMARKPLSEKSIVDNVLKHRTGAINIDECRVEGEVKRPDTNPDFRDVAKKAMAKGGQDKLNFNQITGAERKRAEGIPDGRFPANVMHDGLDTEWSRYFYCPKASKSERNNSTVKNNHPTVKPQQLMQYLCRMVTPKGGTVLDMFMGSGSTGMAAKDEGFDFIGIEKSKEYFKIAEARIESVEVKSTLQEFME